MGKPELLAWALEQCDTLVNSNVMAYHADWFDIDKPKVIEAYNQNEFGVQFVLCLRKTGADVVILDKDQQMDRVIADINNNILKGRNEHFYIINPFFKEVDPVTSLRAFTWCMYYFRDRYNAAKFEADGTVQLIY